LSFEDILEHLASTQALMYTHTHTALVTVL